MFVVNSLKKFELLILKEENLVMPIIKTFLVLALMTACGVREDKFLWDELTNSQRSAIESGQSDACIASTESLIETLKANSNDSFNDFSIRQHFEITSDSNVVDVIILYADSTEIYVMVGRNSSIDDIDEYQIINSDDYIYKITTTNNSEQWEKIQSAMCTISTSDSDNEIENTYTDSTSNFNYTLKRGVGTGDGEESNIDSFTFNNQTTFDHPAFFQLFAMSRSDIDRDENGNETTNSTITYTFAQSSDAYYDDTESTNDTGDSLSDRVDDALKCEYSSITSYTRSDNLGLQVPTNNCSTTQYTVPGF